MAFVISGPHSQVSIDDLDAPILELPERLKLDLPQFARIAVEFTSSFEVTGPELRKLSDEVFRLLDKFRAFKESQLKSLGMVESDDPVVQATVFDEIVRRNPVHAQLEALLACVKQTVADDGVLRCKGS
ncbi:MAG: hypothetical protein ACI85K_003281 [Hyphomicrobiaceae bacterium]|jgi:hypothetical protein